MNLNIEKWKYFKVCNIFKLKNGRGITKEEIEDNKGTFTVVQSGEENNGVIGKIDLEYCKQMNYTFSTKPCLTVARTGSAGFVSFQYNGCVVGDSAKILLLNDDVATTEHYLFLQTILNANRFKYTYGRKVTEEKYMNDYIKLPIKYNTDGKILIDKNKKYSDEGYIPDWEFMENYIKEKENDISVKEILNTKNKNNEIPKLKIEKWKEFKLKNLFNIKYGVNLELNKCIESECGVNFVSRTGENNGVSAKVEKFDNIEPQKAGLITVAGGGSVLSTFLQNRPFYSGRDLYTLELKKVVSDETKLFIVTVIKENKYKYNYGRQANKTLPDLEIKLPIKRDGNGEPIIDNNYTYSHEGYIPDWEFMESYIKSLPYGDKI